MIVLLKLNDEQRQVIIQSVKLNNSKDNILKLCKEYNITKQYIYKLVKKDYKQEIEQSITDNLSEFTKKANRIIDLVFQRIEEELKTNDKITISQLSTTLGILYDKSRLENNQSTSNNAININIKVEK